MTLLLAVLAIAAVPEPIFTCSLGKKRVEVTQETGSLVYRFGARRRSELELRAAPDTGTVFYHRTLYNRGEDQALRFTNEDYSYIVYSHWQAPGNGEAETMVGGLIVLKDQSSVAERVEICGSIRYSNYCRSIIKTGQRVKIDDRTNPPPFDPINRHRHGRLYSGQS
jgi:hypothetical protein